MRCGTVACWYGEPNAASHAIGYAMHRSRSHDGVIRVYDVAGHVIETHEHAVDRREFEPRTMFNGLDQPNDALELV